MKDKLNLLYFFVSISFLLGACGDDDDDDSADPLVGTWESVSFSQTDCDNLLPDVLDFPCGGCFINVFRSDGTMTSRAVVPGVLDESAEGTYTVDGDMLNLCDENGANCTQSSLEQSGDELSIISEIEGCTFTVKLERS